MNRTTTIIVAVVAGLALAAAVALWRPAGTPATDRRGPAAAPPPTSTGTAAEPVAADDAATPGQITDEVNRLDVGDVEREFRAIDENLNQL